MRLAYVSAFSATFLTVLERNATKPFNPLLGETYELVTSKFKFIAERFFYLSDFYYFMIISFPNKGIIYF